MAARQSVIDVFFVADFNRQESHPEGERLLLNFKHTDISLAALRHGFEIHVIGEHDVLAAHAESSHELVTGGHIDSVETRHRRCSCVGADSGASHEERQGGNRDWHACLAMPCSGCSRPGGCGHREGAAPQF